MRRTTVLLLLVVSLSCRTQRTTYNFSQYHEFPSGAHSYSDGPPGDDRPEIAQRSNTHEILPGTATTTAKTSPYRNRVRSKRYEVSSAQTQPVTIVSTKKTGRPKSRGTSPGSPKKNIFSILGLVCTVLIPFTIVSVVPAIVFSILGLKSEFRKLSTVLLWIMGVALVLALLFYVFLAIVLNEST